MRRFLVVAANSLGVASILGVTWFPTPDTQTRVCVSICAVLIGFGGVFNFYNAQTYLKWYRQERYRK